MNFKTHGRIDVNGAYLQGSVTCSYNTLVKVFGYQHNKGDEYKTDAEWEIMFVDGTVATIYNWKNGKNYCGSMGKEVKDITNWHIGGHKPQAAYLVKETIKLKS